MLQPKVYIKSLDLVLPVEIINFHEKTVEVYFNDDAEKLSYEELKELALDYFINDDGCNSANYEYEFDY